MIRDWSMIYLYELAEELFRHFEELLFSGNFASAKVSFENETLAKISEFYSNKNINNIPLLSQINDCSFQVTD